MSKALTNGSNSAGQAEALGAELCSKLPKGVPHAISVSLPEWRDNLDYVNGVPRVMDLMKSGYPRFRVHHLIDELSDVCRERFGTVNEKCYLFPSSRFAEACREYLERFAPRPPKAEELRVTAFDLPINNNFVSEQADHPSSVVVYAAFFPIDFIRVAKSFWQHTGLGISSRVAEYCLSILAYERKQPIEEVATSTRSSPSNLQSPLPSPPLSNVPNDPNMKPPTALASSYAIALLHSLPISEAAIAKSTIRQRIADLVVEDVSLTNSERSSQLMVTRDDVILYPTGMSAIWHCHHAILECFPGAKSVCFGFPYTDTLKVLEKWGPGANLFARADEADLESLITLLETSRASGNPIAALWCEYPSNPLLRTPPLEKLRQLADEYGFVLCLDDTIGSFANVDVLPFVDCLLTSLSKVFQGTGNVMGGSCTLNPKSRYYSQLKEALTSTFEDNYWSEDAVQMEINSRDYIERIHKMNTNANVLVDFLRSRALNGHPEKENAGDALVIRDVFYPRYVTPDLYEVCRRGSAQQRARLPALRSIHGDRAGGYSMLFSITFTSPLASETFYNHLKVAKGPSLGTNFTLVCPYTILGHPFELEWAASHGVESGIVRVSAGLEDTEMLMNLFREALRITESACL
ncbi:PLP-dependent transferase [Clavulina sp. PMI_390]|nr:PLP-dependent transferase [Clavulina sp. PMI_390]